MHTTRLTIQGHQYLLDAKVDVPALQLEICDAMRKGGGIVSFAASHDRPLTVIVSPGVAVLFETLQLPESDELNAPDADYASAVSHYDGY